MTRNFVAMLTAAGLVGLTVGCAAKVTVPPPVVAEVTPPPVVVADTPPPPPPPRLATVCDAEIRPDGHLHFPHEVEFDIGKATLKSTDTTNKIVQCLVDFMTNNKMVTKFRLEGYTDSDGNADANTKLSDDRAAAIIAAMTSKGVEPARLWGKGFGPKKPVAANDTPEHKAMNRRVEFHIDEINAVHINPERLQLAMNPPAPVATTTAVVAAPAVGVTVATPAVAVPGVVVATPGVAVAAPTVAVGVPTVAVGVGVGGAPAGAPAGKKDPKKEPPKKDK